METVACSVCKSTSYENFVVNNGFNIVRCVDCLHVYLSPRPDDKEIGKFYTSSYLPHSNKKSLFKRIYTMVQRFAFFWKEKIISSYASNRNVLDFGGGRGDFVTYLNKRGYNSTLYDKNIDKNTVLNNKYIKAVWSEKDIENNYFDVITMWHSLEHVHDLENLLSLINASLKDDGSLIVSVPNVNAPEIIFFKNSWVAYDSPRHLNHFSSKSLERIFNGIGFKVVERKIMLHDTFFNILMSLKKNPKLILATPIIIVYSIIFILIKGPNRSSSLFFVFKRK